MRINVQLLGWTQDAPVATSINVVLGVGGPMGASTGGAAESYTHTQASPSDEWTINHNLGVRPLIAVFSPGGAEVQAEILHMSTNQARIYFASAYAGTARCI